MSDLKQHCRNSILLPLLLVALWASMMTANSVAQSSADRLDLQQYPHARMVYSSQSDDDDYVLALGSFRKTSDAWVVNREQRLAGRLERFTLELPDDHSAKDGFRFYTRQLEALNSRELYGCVARECGPSNSWANNHFHVIQLYGLDQYQYYAVYEVIQKNQPPAYVSLYAVLRGNKRVYVQVEILQTEKISDEGIASDPDTLSKLLLSRGYYVFPELFENNESNSSRAVRLEPDIRKVHLQALIDLLQKERGLTIALVGHDYGKGNLAEQQKKSEQYAQALKSALLQHGITAQRISVYGLGSLAPAGRGNSGASARVEVVRMPD